MERRKLPLEIKAGFILVIALMLFYISLVV